MFEADGQRSRKGRSRLVYTAATAGPSAVAAGHGRGDCTEQRRFRVDREIHDLAAGSGALRQEADTCPLDRDPDIYGICALHSCRAPEQMFYFVAALLLKQSQVEAPEVVTLTLSSWGPCGDEGGSDTALPDSGGFVGVVVQQSEWLDADRSPPRARVAAIRARPISSERRMATPRVSTIMATKSLPNTLLPSRSQMM